MSESWETASLEEIKIEENKSKRPKKSIKTTKMIILHQCLLIVELLKQVRSYKISKGVNEYEKFQNLKENSSGELIFGGFFGGGCSTREDSSKIDWIMKINQDIDLFVALNLNNIECQLYFVLGNQVTTFIEYVLNGKIVENKHMHTGFIFSINMNGDITDQTHYFSKSCTNFRIFSKILNLISLELSKKSFIDIKIQQNLKNYSEFTKINQERLNKIPTSLIKMKIHPLYILESLCKPYEFIYPKRPICGFIKGEAVYQRSNLQKLKTEGGWYRMGRILKDDSNGYVSGHFSSRENHVKPYRKFNEKRLYAEFQTIPVKVKGLSGRTMDFFHENFIPEDCFYFDGSPEICNELKIDYAECVVGFKYKERLIRGFFVYKKDAEIIKDLMKERDYFENISEYVEKYEKTIEDWNSLIQKVNQYLRIKARIGLD